MQLAQTLRKLNMKILREVPCHGTARIALRSFPEFKNMKTREKQDSSILHLNISSISAHINDLRNFLNLADQKIDIICISESRISTKSPQTTNIDLPGYNIEQIPTESSAGGALFPKDLYFPKLFI